MIKRRLLLFLVILFNLIIKFWRLGIIPPLLGDNSLALRFLSAIVSLFFTLLIYLLVRKIYHSSKLSLLSVILFSILPQTVIEGRIVSILVYPPFWIENIPRSVSLFKLISNFFTLISFNMLLFNNTTFYWGGIRDFGVIYLSLLPFFITGVFVFTLQKKITPLILLMIIFLLISMSPKFPENRTVLLSIPLFSLIIAKGILNFWQNKNIHIRFISILLFIFLFYELIQFFHFYTIHYPRQVTDFSDNIVKPF